ncbi:hypothetical protein [Streptomyces sp. NPDC053427]|uniref:hypothetical protein n=1 Tax=Streptomyces sp. NPDC053427 TaxID=3365701 RepID=UPI0037D88B25
MDRLAGAEGEVGPPQFVLDGCVIVLGSAAQLVQADDFGHVGGRQWAVPARLDRRHVGGCGAVEFGGVMPQRPTLRTVDTKVTTAGRPDAVGV